MGMSQKWVYLKTDWLPFLCPFNQPQKAPAKLKQAERMAGDRALSPARGQVGVVAHRGEAHGKRRRDLPGAGRGAVGVQYPDGHVAQQRPLRGGDEDRQEPPEHRGRSALER